MNVLFLYEKLSPVPTRGKGAGLLKQEYFQPFTHLLLDKQGGSCAGISRNSVDGSDLGQDFSVIWVLCVIYPVK